MMKIAVRMKIGNFRFMTPHKMYVKPNNNSNN